MLHVTLKMKTENSVILYVCNYDHYLTNSYLIFSTSTSLAKSSMRIFTRRSRIHVNAQQNNVVICKTADNSRRLLCSSCLGLGDVNVNS